MIFFNFLELVRTEYEIGILSKDLLHVHYFKKFSSIDQERGKVGKCYDWLDVVSSNGRLVELLI